MTNSEQLAEQEVTVDNLLSLFERAFIKAERDEDDDIIVTDNGVTIVVGINIAAKMLKFLSVFGFKEGSIPEKKLTFLNKLNSQVMLSRFSTPTDNILTSEYFLLYEKGILNYQIINSLRLFAQITVSSIREFDNDDLIE
ncbi:MAG: hypothetical protein RIS84_1283 [Pseudomonadota bacterium]|jgi:hypothetical protein